MSYDDDFAVRSIEARLVCFADQLTATLRERDEAQKKWIEERLQKNHDELIAVHHTFMATLDAAMKSLDED